MNGFKCYRKRTNCPVVAIQLKLDTDGFTYQKWGGTQRCKAGDWIVLNGNDVYTIDADVFAGTYREVELGKYVKSTSVRAKIASVSGTIKTREGSSDYKPGDYIVYNDQEMTDGYCMSAEEFLSMYEQCDD